MFIYEKNDESAPRRIMKEEEVRTGKANAVSQQSLYI